MHFLFYHYIYVKPDFRLSYKHHCCSITWSQQTHLCISMSSLALLLLLYLCVSTHACTARPLSLTIKATAKYHFDEEIDNAKLLETLTSSRLKDYTLKENQVQGQKVAKNEINICESCIRTSTLKEMIDGDSGTSFQTDSSSFLATMEERRHARSMLGPARHHFEETVVTNAGDTTEDIVEMDYAQPHRKPPIHNEKP